MLILFAAPAMAGGFYHPEDVARLSTVFNKAAEELAPTYESRQALLQRVGQDLEILEVGVAILGDSCPNPSRTWAEQARKTLAAQYLATQRHADLVQEDYAKVFGEALERALQAVPGGKDARECTVRGGMTGMMRAPRPSCRGDDLNEALAAQLDGDQALQAEVTEINGVPWPEVDNPQNPQPVAPEPGPYVVAGALAQAFIRPTLDRLKEELEADLEEMGDVLDAPDPQSIASAEERKEAYLTALTGQGRVLLTFAEEALPKLEKRGVAAFGYCANAPGLGGCEGDDQTEAVVAALRGDKKFLRSIERSF